jgi:CRISPR-associated endonuclease Csn1
MLRLRLFRELAGSSGASTRCVYTGDQISISQLFTPEVQVDHVLPYSRTLDDSIANKVLAKARANRFKAHSSPFEAFGHSPDGYNWQEILERAAALSRRRLSRFTAEAMERFEQDGGFIARQLTDTAYMSRLAREYLTGVCPPNRVWAVNGSLTALVRGKWGLNKLLAYDGVKNRLDHRHHAIDATVIACMDRSLVQRIATAAAAIESTDGSRLLASLEYPWPSFLAGLTNAIARVVISHRPDHNPCDALHNETAYGARAAGGATAGATKSEVHSYVPLATIADAKPVKVRDHVVDQRHAYAIAAILAQHSTDRAARRAAVEAYGKTHHLRRLRWTENLAVIPIADRRSGQPYKYVKGDGNYCYEIWADQRGNWTGDVVDVFTANSREYSRFAADGLRYRREARKGQPLIMRLVVNDVVAIESEHSRLLYRVQQISKGKVVLAYHVAAGDPTRNGFHIPEIRTVMTVAPSVMCGLKARRVFVDILGRVFDPGCCHAGSYSGAGAG